MNPTPHMFIGSTTNSYAAQQTRFAPVRPKAGGDEEQASSLAKVHRHEPGPATKVNLSDEAREALRSQVKSALGNKQEVSHEAKNAQGDKKEVSDKKEKALRGEDKHVPGSKEELTPEDKQKVVELKARDAEVRAHENAHLAASGGHAKSGIKYEYQRGPDNEQYAIGGHVEIDTSEVPGDPERTIQKAETVRRAALAPADPSGADRRVAAKASNTLRDARAKLGSQASEKATPEKKQDTDGPGNSAQPTDSIATRYALAAYSNMAA